MRRFSALEGLRGYLAWWVVLAHAYRFTPLATLAGPEAHLERWFLRQPERAVDLFVVLSGFVITHLLVTSTDGYVAYLGRRVLRLWPVYLVCLALALATRPLWATAFALSPAAPDFSAARLADQGQALPVHLLLHLSMLHGVVPDPLLRDGQMALLPTAWSLSLEWQFYLVAPVVVAGLRRGRAGRPAVLLGLLAAGLAATWLPPHWYPEHPAFLPLALPCFGLGICSRLLLDAGRRLVGDVPSARREVVELAFAMVLFGLSVAGIVLVIWLPVLLVVAADSVVPPQRGHLAWRMLRGVLDNPVSRRLGAWSYATYLVHVPLLALVLGGATALAGGAGPVARACLALLAVAAVLPVSALLHRTVEQPAVALGRRRSHRSPAPEGAAAAGAPAGTP